MAERYISPYTLPNEREREILTIIIEEAAEVQQRACKALRFGLREKQPGQNLDNAWRTGLELGDLTEIVGMAVAEGLIPAAAIVEGRANKRQQLAKFMQTVASVEGDSNG